MLGAIRVLGLLWFVAMRYCSTNPCSINNIKTAQQMAGNTSGDQRALVKHNRCNKGSGQRKQEISEAQNSDSSMIRFTRPILFENGKIHHVSPFSAYCVLPSGLRFKADILRFERPLTVAGSIFERNYVMAILTPFLSQLCT